MVGEAVLVGAGVVGLGALAAFLIPRTVKREEEAAERTSGEGLQPVPAYVTVED